MSLNGSLNWLTNSLYFAYSCTPVSLESSQKSRFFKEISYESYQSISSSISESVSISESEPRDFGGGLEVIVADSSSRVSMAVLASWLA